MLDNLAYKTAELFSKYHKVDIDCGMIPVPMYVFALMPYRHASTMSSVQFVQDCIESTAGREEQMDALVRRFRKATNRRMAVLQDEARRTGGNEEDTTFSDEDILETFPFEADMSKATSHIVCKTIQAFLYERGISASRTDGNPIPVIVSLSGGVDSMVIASVLAHLSNACDYNLHVVGVHIDYANRPESGAEADYVRRYCERLGITYKCRRIDEVTRGVTARDDYERIAREVRYNIYRETVQECQQMDADWTEVGVMLGHHRGDLRENVLSNSHKGCGPLDLSGMTPVSRNDGVMIYRPLLPLEKKEIFDYAHTFGVPYFKDTTPHWSTRGKLRNKLLPLLEEIYGEGSMNNLSTLATESDSARELLMQTVLNPFLDQVERKPMGIMFGTAPWKDQGLFFWKFVLREALHRAGLGMFSDKSVVEFLKRVKVDCVKAGWLQCRRDYAVYLSNDGKVFVLFPDSFPFRKSDHFDFWDRPVSFGVQNAVSIGPWKVHAELVETTELPHEAEALLERKAVSSMEDFMKGYIRYYVKVPSKDTDALQSLVFVREFNRQTRPRAWKSVDLKIQSVLPILGAAGEASVDAVGDNADWRLAKVVLEREGADHSS
jgi:tRNA(Ile)-lysidine synthetase-like protein